VASRQATVISPATPQLVADGRSGHRLAVPGHAGLENDRLALARAGQVKRPGHLEVLADMIQGVQPGRVEDHIPAGPAVADVVKRGEPAGQVERASGA
jgi:hypothetical protein